MKNAGTPTRISRWVVACLAVLVIAGCSTGGYDRGEWYDTFMERYGLSPTSATCVLDQVEARGLEERFAGDTVDVDSDIESIVIDCVPITERALLGVW